MIKLLKITALILFVSALNFAGCDNGGKTRIIPVGGGQSEFITGTIKHLYINGVGFNMAYVSALSFFTSTGDGKVDHSFWIADTEVTYELWYAVHIWAIANGYTFANPGREGHNGTITDPVGEPPTTAKNEPVTTINWNDALVWCNAATEWYNNKKGTNYTCVYKKNGTPIRDSRDSNDSSCDSVIPDMTATGFRLPTGEEWELAAQYIDDTNSDNDIKDLNEYYPSNYASGAIADCTDAAATQAVAWYSANSGNSTHAVRGLAANALGLYDMSGNVHEWCFDRCAWHGRGIWGGYYNSNASNLQVGLGSIACLVPTLEDYTIGFRLAKTQ